jgi:hypothetical protein|tara:strand:+ start:242 stop:418 length:177 start_codon:yes stop_codon:yes gene_type:complete
MKKKMNMGGTASVKKMNMGGPLIPDTAKKMMYGGEAKKMKNGGAAMKPMGNCGLYGRK